MKHLYPGRIPSYEQKIVEALMWILRNEHHLSVQEIVDLVQGAWKHPTVRAYTNSKLKPDVRAARSRLNAVPSEQYSTPELGRRPAAVEKGGEQHDVGQLQDVRDNLGYWMNRYAEQGLSAFEVMNALPTLWEFVQRGVNPDSLASFMAECKKAADDPEEWDDWGEVVEQFLWMWDNDRMTQVDMRNLRQSIQKLESKGIKIINVDEFADLIAKTASIEAKAIIEEADNLKTLRETRRREAAELVEFRKKAATEREELDSAILKRREKLESMQEQIERSAPVLKEVRKLEKMGMKDADDLVRLRETVQRKYNKDFDEFVNGMQAHKNFEDVRNKTKDEETRLASLKQQCRGYEQLLHIHDPLMNEGYDGNEIRGFIEDAMKVGTRLGSMQEGRRAFREIMNLKDLRDEADSLRESVQKYKDEEAQVNRNLHEILPRLQNFVTKLAEQLQEGTFDLTARYSAADLTKIAEKELDVTTGYAPLNPVEQKEKLAAAMGIVTAFDKIVSLKPHRMQPLFLQGLIKAALKLSDRGQMTHTISLEALLGKGYPANYNTVRLPVKELLRTMHEQVELQNKREFDLNINYFK